MMNKKGIIALLIMFFVVALVACTGRADGPEIFADDVTDVEAGEYTLRYSIPDYDKYAAVYNLNLSVRVYDEENVELPVASRRTVTLERGKKYTVILRLTGSDGKRDIDRIKKYTVTTKQKDVLVCFFLRDGDTVKAYETTPYIGVPFGGSLALGDLPEVPYFYDDNNEPDGSARRIVAKKWVIVNDDGTETDVTQDRLIDLKDNITVCSSYEYEYSTRTFTVTFDSNGGSAVEPFTGNIRSYLERPSDPVCAEKIFLGWYEDEDCQVAYNWKADVFLSDNFTLYAKWVNSNASVATPDSYFSFEQKTDNFGNDYYELSAKDPDRFPGDVVLPNGHESLPVRAIKKAGFTPTSSNSSPIVNLTVPSTYDLDFAQAFMSCKNLRNVTFEEGNERTVLNVSAFQFCTALQKVVLPSGLLVLDDKCFFGCVSLNEISLPDGLIRVGKSAFGDCKALIAFTLPDSVTTLSENAFAGCENLSEFYISAASKLNSVAQSAFNNTDLVSLTLPAALAGTAVFDNERITVVAY